jgi:hypothetical protein
MYTSIYIHIHMNTHTFIYTRKHIRYDWLWKDDKELIYKKFASKKPSLSDFEGELKKFLMLEQEMIGIYVYICICLYVCIYIYIYTYIYIYI